MKNLKLDKSVGKTIPLMFRTRKTECPDIVLQYVKNENKEYDTYTYESVYKSTLELACALKKLGVKRGDRVGLISDNCRQWFITDMALLSLGASDVPRGCDTTGSEIRFILNFVECNLCFLENSLQLKKILEKLDEVPLLKTVILFKMADQEILQQAKLCGIEVYSFEHFEKQGKTATDAELKAIENEMDKTDPSEIATIIFTSGTTGTPKGVMLTHDCYIAQCEAVKQTLTFLKDGDKWLSVLPIWHAFERTINYMIIALRNSIIYSSTNASVMLSDMETLHPAILSGVPRLWDAFAKNVFRAMKKNSAIVFYLFTSALAVGKVFNWVKNKVFGLNCRYKKTCRILDSILYFLPFILLLPINAFFDALVFKKIRAKFGGKMKYAISGGGSLQPDVDAFYGAINLKLLEGYGITEAGPVLSVRHPKKARFGCVGQIYPSALVKVVAMSDGKVSSDKPLSCGEHGIILAKGRQIMKGYFKKDDLTKSVIDKDGWLNTGDIGTMTYDNEIKIIGRAKDTIVLLGGENIEPSPIEQAIACSCYVETAVVVGQDKKYLGALIVPSKDLVTSYAEENKIEYSSYENLLENSEIQKLFRNELSTAVCTETGFRIFEKISKFVLLPESFTVGKEINVKLEIMRHKVSKIYENQINSLF